MRKRLLIDLKEDGTPTNSPNNKTTITNIDRSKIEMYETSHKSLRNSLHLDLN
jgi:hypothetical protein